MKGYQLPALTKTTSDDTEPVRGPRIDVLMAMFDRMLEWEEEVRQGKAKITYPLLVPIPDAPQARTEKETEPK